MPALGALAFIAAYHLVPILHPLPLWFYPVLPLALFLKGKKLPLLLLMVLLGITLKSTRLTMVPREEFPTVRGTVVAPWTRSEYAHRTLLATAHGTVPLYVGNLGGDPPLAGETVEFRGRRLLFDPPPAGLREGPGFGYQVKSAVQFDRSGAAWWRTLLYAPLRLNEILYRRAAPHLESRPALASLVKALVFARYDADDEAFFDAFRRGGVLHLLAVSGLHVGVFLLYLLLVLRLLRAPPWVIAAAAILFLFLYAGFCGWRAPILRAALMGTLHYLGILLRRPQASLTTLWTSLPINALLMPHHAFTAGFWFSYAAAFAVLVFVPARKGTLFSLAYTGIPVQLFLAPLLLFAFGSFTWGAVVLNPILIPLASLLLLALPVVVLAPVPLYLEAVQTAAGWVTALVEGFGEHVWWGSYLPYPPGWLVVLFYLCLVPLLAKSPGRPDLLWKRLLPAGALFALLYGLTLPVPSRQVLFLDVGQGAATLFVDGGHSVLVDTGKRPFSTRLLPPLLREAALPLDALVLTHPELDHDRWAERLVRDAPPGTLLFPRVFEARYGSLAGLARRRGVTVETLESGMAFEAGAWRFSVLHPGPGPCRSDNACSLVLLAEGGGRSVLLMGDAERDLDPTLFSRVPFRPDAMQAAHHGSRTGNSPGLLRCLRPRVVVVSVGANNPYGHPHRETLEVVAASGALLWRTDQRGAYRLRFR